MHTFTRPGKAGTRWRTCRTTESPGTKKRRWMRRLPVAGSNGCARRAHHDHCARHADHHVDRRAGQRDRARPAHPVPSAGCSGRSYCPTPGCDDRPSHGWGLGGRPGTGPGNNGVKVGSNAAPPGNNVSKGNTARAASNNCVGRNNKNRPRSRPAPAKNRCLNGSSWNLRRNKERTRQDSNSSK